MIPCQNEFFDIPDDITYLNCAYFSPLMKPVRDAGMLGVNRKARPWQIHANHFFDESEEVRTLFAQLISARADDVALIPAVSYGLAVAAANIPLQAGDEIVVLDEQFPSNYYCWREAAAPKDANIVTVKRDPVRGWTEAVLQHINDHTAVVTLPNVHWTDGSVIDLRQIAQACKRHRAELVLDLTQSLGAYPFSLRELDAAFVICAGYKWLLGPYSTAFMYVNPRYHKASPLELNWLNRKDSEKFSGLVEYNTDFQQGARRFDVGERSNFALLPMVVAALRQILHWGVDEISQTLAQLTGALADRAEALGLSVAPASERSTHLIGLRFPGSLPADITERLTQEKIYVSIRGNAIRVAPHVYNSLAHVEKLIGILQGAGVPDKT